MLLQADLKNFFEQNSILLCEEKLLLPIDVDLLYLQAREHGYTFAAFVHYGVISPDKNGVLTCFNSWDELYDCYLSFVSGYMGNQA